jgi:phosphate transport system substrate-binding protein
MGVKNMLKKIALATTFATLLSTAAHAGDQIRAVGSSTVYPFTTAAAEAFGKATKNKTPIIESIGTGGGFKLFCSGAGDDTPDISDASRAIKDSEKELCAKNGVKDITEVKIGFDGIVIANAVGEKKLALTKKQVFLALARKIPAGGKLVDNKNKLWSDIDKSLPAEKIEVYGPPPTSGTRDAFAELVMDKVCEEMPEFTSAYPDKEEKKKACQLIREDGVYIEAGENDNLIVQKLKSNPHAFGIFGYSFLEENASSIQGASIDEVEPTFENISSSSYPISRPLFVYVKNAHLKTTKGLGDFVKEIASTRAIGEDGYLVSKGLIPLNKTELTEVQGKVAKLK